MHGYQHPIPRHPKPNLPTNPPNPPTTPLGVVHKFPVVKGYADAVVVTLLLPIAALCFILGVYLIATGRRPRQPELTDRLRPFSSRRVSEEAEEWLRRQP
jgi:hypothetical protein